MHKPHRASTGDPAISDPAAAPAGAVEPDPFVHLHAHTEYSLLDGAARIDELVATAKQMGQPAVAMTDHGNLYGAVEFYSAAKVAGINPIIGCEVYMTQRSRHQREVKIDRDPWHLVLLAKDRAGYRNLVRLVSKAQLEGFYQKPRIDKELLAEHSEGIIGLSACIGGELPQSILTGNLDAAERVAREHREILGHDNYFLELQDHGIEAETPIREGLVEIARRLDLPLVATNDAHYITAGDAEAHDILLCLQTGARRSEEKRFKFHGPHFYLASGGEMRERFSRYSEAAANTVEVARRCHVELELGNNLLPTYSPIPEGHDADGYLAELCERGLRERYGDTPNAEQRERLAMELDVIRQTGFSAYFLIVWDLIRAGRADGVIVGPGRGSAAGSIVAYVLKITNVCPLAYGLIFERFLNIERLSMPDIDIDFDDKRRDRVLRYVQNKYGRDRVAQIITFGTMAARASIRDVGRVLEVPLPDVDRLAKLVPQTVGITLETALAGTPELRALYEQDADAKRVLDIAMRLEGITRNASTHAAGVVIAPSPLIDLVPVQRSTSGDDGPSVTQFDMNGVARIGLLKVDFLGLSNLSVIDECTQTITLTRGIDLDIDAIPLDDPATYALLCRADTHGVFQMEMAGAKKIFLDMQPQTLLDISVAGALNRPGPIEGGVIDVYMKRKRGEEVVSYAVPELEPILAESYGTIVYQDQVMKIASVVAGYSLGEADVLRAAMGKKNKEKMAKEKVKFMTGAAARGVDGTVAEELFDLLALFASYGFNKCLSGDTTVVDALTGERTTIRSLHDDRRPFTVHGLGEGGRLLPRPVIDVVSNGFKTVYTLTTAQGKRIKATSTHRFRTFGGWQRLAELRIGDRIAAPRHLSVATSESWRESELVTLAGLLSEGNTCHPTCLYYYNNNLALINDFATNAAQFPGTVARIASRRDGRYEVCVSTGRGMRYRTGNRPWNGMDGSGALAVDDELILADEQRVRSGAFFWAEALGIVGVKATAKRVPNDVFRLCDRDIALFIGRMWSGDGYLCGPGGWTPFYATSSPQLAIDLQILLLRLGIISGVHAKRFQYRGRECPGYTVHLVGEWSIDRFVAVVGPHCLGREAGVSDLAAYRAGTQRGLCNVDTIPVEVRRWVDDERRRASLTWVELERQSGVSMRDFCGRAAHKRGYPRATIARLAEFFASQGLGEAADSDVFWDRIVSIDPDGVEQTYDLTVDVDHSFVADGLVVHNSHAVAYGLITYQTAYLKANFPLEYLAALCNMRAGDFDKLKQSIQDCTSHGLTVLPPDINRSRAGFSVGDVANREILYGLASIKNVGEKAVEMLLIERDANGPFLNLLDLCLRVPERELNRRVLEAMVQSGACDGLGERCRQLAIIDLALIRASQVRRERDSGQTSLFGGPAAAPEEGGSQPMAHFDELRALPDVAAASDTDKLNWERQLLGVYLSGHPLSGVGEALAERIDTQIADLGAHLEGLQVQIGGAVRSVRAFVPRKSTNGQRMAFLEVEDRSGVCEVVVFARVFEECVKLLSPDAVVIVRGRVEGAARTGAPVVVNDDDAGAEEPPAKIIAEALFALDDPRLLAWKRDRTVHLVVRNGAGDVVKALCRTIEANPGDAQVVLHIETPDHIDEVSLGEEHQVTPSPAFERSVAALLGEQSYRVEVKRNRAPEDNRPRRRVAAAV